MGKEFVMVPRELLERATKDYTGRPNWDALEPDRLKAVEELGEILAKPAEQHQGEPVALPERRDPVGLTSSGGYSFVKSREDRGWNACLDEIAKLGPLYTHPGLDAWQKGRDGMRAERDAAMGERDTLRAQLAEAHALLRDIHDGTISGFERYSKIEEILSASGEPSAPKSGLPGVRYLDNQDFQADRMPSTPVGDGITDDTEAVARVLGASVVERDERAAFEKQFPSERLARDGDGYANDSISSEWEGWQARAALERKPPTTPRDAFAAWEPTGNPIRGVNGRLAAKAGFDAGWCAGWTECRADMERKP